MRLVPSDVVRHIRQLFPSTEFDRNRRLTFYNGHSKYFRTILELVEQIPPELLTLSPADFCAFATALASMRGQIEYWMAHGDEGFDLSPGYDTDPVTLLYFLLQACPDSAPAPATDGPDFIEDEALRLDLRTDKSNSERAFSNRAMS